MSVHKPKLDAAITLHLPEDFKTALEGLADVERAGQGAGEYARAVLIDHVQNVRRDTERKAVIFGLTGNLGN